MCLFSCALAVKSADFGLCEGRRTAVEGSITFGEWTLLLFC